MQPMQSRSLIRSLEFAIPAVVVIAIILSSPSSGLAVISDSTRAQEALALENDGGFQPQSQTGPSVLPGPLTQYPLDAGGGISTR